MTHSTLELFELTSEIVPDPVPCAVLLPPGYTASTDSLPLCLSLHGGGSSRDALVQSQPLFESWWKDGSLEPMVIASASTGELSFYFDDPNGAS
jgi:hypothetical protein